MACDLLHAKGLSRRHVVDRLVHGAAFGCLLLALGCLVWLLTGLVSTGWSGFSQSEVRLAISYPLEGEIKAPQLLKEALLAKLPALEPADQRMAARLISSKAPFELVTHLKTHPALRGKTEDVWVLLSDEADMQVKGKAVAGKLQPVQEAALATLQSQGDIRTARPHCYANDSCLECQRIVDAVTDNHWPEAVVDFLEHTIEFVFGQGLGLNVL